MTVVLVVALICIGAHQVCAGASVDPSDENITTTVGAGDLVQDATVAETPSVRNRCGIYLVRPYTRADFIDC